MKESDDRLKKIAKGAGIFLIGLIISKALAYIYRLIIARIGVEQYGLLSIALAVFGIFVTISLFGLGEGVVRFVSFYKGKLDQRRIKGIITSALKITLPLSLACSAFLFFASKWVAVTFFHNDSLSILFKIIALGIPLDVLRNIFFSSMRAFQKVEYEVYAKSIAENVGKVVLTLIIFYLGFEVVGAAIVYLISILISFVLSLYFLEKKVFSIISTKIVSIRSDKILLSYSLPLLFAGFVFLIIQWTDTLMLGNLRNVFEVGLYNAALPTAFLLFLFPSAIRALFFPILSELYAQNKKHAFKSTYQRVVKWVLIVNSIIFVFLVIFSHQIIRILFGEAYIQDKVSFFGTAISLSVLALIVLSFGMFFGFLTSPCKDTLLVLKKTKFILLNTVIAASLNVMLNYILIPSYGIIGAAIATGFAYFILATLLGLEAYLITRINPFKLDCVKVAGTALFALLIMSLLKVYLISNIFYLTLTGFTFLGVYLVLLLLTKSLDKEDLIIVNSILIKFKIRKGFIKKV